jgi:hypothetical protein
MFAALLSLRARDFGSVFIFAALLHEGKGVGE